MLDIKFIKEHPEIVKLNLKKRFKEDKISLIDKVIKNHDSWLKLKKDSEELRCKRNQLSEEINELKKKNESIKNLIREVQEIPDKIKSLEEKQSKIYEEMQSILTQLPNILDKNVPIGKDASENKEIKKIGKIIKPKFELLNHVDLVEKRNLADFEQGTLVAGKRFNFLIGDLALLDIAIQRYAIDFLTKKGFTFLVTPLMLNRKSIAGAVNLNDFEDVIYKVENEDLYLIATGEHSLVSLYKNCTFNKKDLPIKICTVTPCFRKEIGGHGVDSKGIFRMHQFNKVEQVVICSPEDSYKYLEEMQGITESFFKSLKIPFRVITICSGDLGPKMSKQYDIEAWFPREQKYKEVTSAGNTTDYQSNKLNIKYINTDGEKKSVHMLNNTMVATSRAMVAILENFQNKDGTVTVPKPLVPYIYNKKKIGGFKK